MNINDLNGTEYDRLSPFRRNKADRCKLEKDKLRSVACGFLINKGLSENYGLCEKNMKYILNAHSKPYFRDYPDIFFNVSHSGDLCIACFSDNEIGCDVQKMDKADLSLARRFFSEDELAYIENSDDKNSAFYRIWTLKESFIKAVGKGLSIPLNNFSFLITDKDISVHQTENSYHYHFTHYFKNEYSVAVCEALR